MPRRYEKLGLDIPAGQWLRVGGLTVLRLGQPPAVAGDAPIGLVASRRLWSTTRPGETCGYLLRVTADPLAEEEGVPERPLFSIASEDDKPGGAIVDGDPQRAIDTLYRAIQRVHPRAEEVYLQYPHEPGYFFGWLHAPVQRTLHGDTVDEEGERKERLPVNRSGCARSQAIHSLVRWRAKPISDPKAMHNDAALRAPKRAADDDPVASATPHYLQREILPKGNIEQLRSLNTVARTRFKVARSNIRALGLGLG